MTVHVNTHKNIWILFILSDEAFICSQQMCLVDCKFCSVLFCGNVLFCDIFLDEKGANNPILVLTELKFVFTTHNETRHILHRLKMTKFAQFSLQRFIQAKCMFQGQLILSYQTTNYITAVSEVLIRIIVGEFCSNLINFRPRGHKT